MVQCNHTLSAVVNPKEEGQPSCVFLKIALLLDHEVINLVFFTFFFELDRNIIVLVLRIVVVLT